MLTWTKSDTGYTSDPYRLEKTPGKRWTVHFRDGVLADGKQFRKLDEAKTVAENHANEHRDGIGMLPPIDVLTAPLPTPKPWATPSAADVRELTDGPKEVSENVNTPLVLPVTVEGENGSDPSTGTVRASAPTTATGTPPGVPTANGSSPGCSPASVEPKPVTLPPWIEPGTSRLSIRNTLERLRIYASIGVRRTLIRFGSGKHNLKFAS